MLLQAVRVLIDVRLATGKMTINQSVEALIDHLAMDRVCAEAETRRYITAPGAPVVHYTGRESIKELKKWAKDRLGPRFTETFFHTAYLQSGPIPVALAKREVDLRIEEELKKPLEKPKEEHHKKEDKRHPPAHPAKTATKLPPKPASKPPAGKKPPKASPKARPKPKARPRPKPRRGATSRPKPRPPAARRPARKTSKKRR
jgi:hypothetical protein